MAVGLRRFVLMLVLGTAISGCSNQNSLVLERHASSKPGKWNFGTAGEFTYAGQLFTTQKANNSATLSPPSFTFNSAAVMGAGTHTGTRYDSGTSKLELAGALTDQELTAAWAPSWNQLIGYWNFNTDFNDSSATVANFTASGNAAIAAPAKLGAGAVTSDGTANSLATATNCAPIYTASQLTVAFWAYVRAKDDYDRFLEVTSSAVLEENTRLRVYMDGSPDQKVRVELTDGTTIFVADAAAGFPLNTWTHVAFTFDGSYLKLYIDGVAVSGSYGNGTVPAIVYNADSRLAVLGSPFGYSTLDGAVDELAIWKQTVTAADVHSLFKVGRQVSRGQYYSKVLDGFELTQLSKARWTSSLPFGKELPGDTDGDGNADGESASFYSEIEPLLPSGLVGLWHLNESSGPALDSSGKGNFGTHYNGPALNQAGRFRGAATYDATAFTLVPDAPEFAITGNISVQAWILKSPGGFYPTIISKSMDGSNFSYVLNYDMAGSNIRFLIGDAAGNYDYATTPAPADGEWHHIVGVADASWVYIYVDGLERARAARTIGAIGITTGSPFCLGALTTSTGCDASTFNGTLDEVALWNRDLSSDEIVQLYRRGANRTKLQFRTCTASDCSDAPAWTGPDGTSATWFSEAQNAASVAASGETTGALNMTAPILDFLQWLNAVTGWQINRASGRYFQFSAWFESDDLNDLCSGTNCKPNITSISLDGVAVIQAARGLSFTRPLSIFSVTETGACYTSATVRYQVSADDGVTYKYWDGTEWAAASGVTLYAEAASQAATHANIGTLASSGVFRFRVLVPTDSASCVLSEPTAE